MASPLSTHDHRADGAFVSGVERIECWARAMHRVAPIDSAHYLSGKFFSFDVPIYVWANPFQALAYCLWRNF